MIHCFARTIFFCFAALNGFVRAQTNCPDGRRPYFSNGGGARPCSYNGNLITGCPTGSTCEFVPNNNPSFGRLCCLTGSTGLVQCPLSTQVLINNNCYDYVRPNGPCTYSWQCTGGSSCIDTKCRCPSEQISVDSNVCIYNNVGIISVVCTLPRVLVGNQCVQSVNPDGRCTYPEQCQGGSTCIENVCVCPYDQYNYIGQCIPKCIDGSYVFYNGGCFQLVGPMGLCQLNQQCQGGSTCASNICQCPTGQTALNGACAFLGPTPVCQPLAQVLINGVCMNYVIAGGSCTYNQQCLGGSLCINGVCQCLGTDVNQGGTCVASQAGTLGSPPQTASCLPGQVSVNGVCYAQAFPNSPCTVPAQCQAGSTCQLGFCRCSPGQIVVNGNCSPVPVAVPVAAPVAAQNQQTFTCLTPGSYPYTDPTSGTVQNCLTSYCPTNYKCEYNNANSQYICCNVAASG